jgi:tRNA threonylcarbamoyladenosine biosynthesis protein TsaE
MLVFHLPDALATQKLGFRLGKLLPAGSTLLLEGDLGAGKTSLVQGIGKGLGIEAAIVSPTFTLINEYPEGRIPLYHFDLYRLEAKEIAELSPELYWEGIEVPAGIVAIEWAQRLPYLPDNYLKIQLRHWQQQRQVEITAVGNSIFLLDLGQN